MSSKLKLSDKAKSFLQGNATTKSGATCVISRHPELSKAVKECLTLMATDPEVRVVPMSKIHDFLLMEFPKIAPKAESTVRRYIRAYERELFDKVYGGVG